MNENKPDTNLVARTAAGRNARGLLPSGLRLHMSTAGSQQRDDVERYIADQFQAVHGARIKAFMPWLISMNCGERRIAAVGVRPAAGQTLFLEQYLSQPVEQAIGRAADRDVARSDVAEIGNLVATQRGASQLLFLLLTGFLHQKRFEWVVFTATPAVLKTLWRLGFQLQELGEADPASLSEDDRAAWGSYYDNRPVVVAGHVPSAMNWLASRRRYQGMLVLFRDQLRALAKGTTPAGNPDGTPAFAA